MLYIHQLHWLERSPVYQWNVKCRESIGLSLPLKAARCPLTLRDVILYALYVLTCSGFQRQSVCRGAEVCDWSNPAGEHSANPCPQAAQGDAECKLAMSVNTLLLCVHVCTCVTDCDLLFFLAAAAARADGDGAVFQVGLLVGQWSGCVYLGYCAGIRAEV